MNAMIAKYLKDFSTPAPADMAGSDILESLSGSSFSDLDFVSEPAVEIDIEAERQKAHNEGFQAASEELGQKHGAELEALSAEHAAELEAMAAAHENEVVGMIHARFHEMTQALSQQLAEQTLQVLLPVFEEEFCRRSISALAKSVHETLQEAGVSAVVVRGPALLYTRLQPLFEADGVESRFIESSAADISVEVNDTVLVSRLANWSRSLAEVTG